MILKPRHNVVPWFLYWCFSVNKPLVLPGVNKKALAKEKSKKIVRPSKEKERYGDSERKAGIYVKSVPLAECYEIPKRTGLPVAGQTMR